MGSLRAHIVIPEDFLKKVDAEVGPRGRSAYIIELAQSEYRRRKLLEFLESDKPVWRDEDHPELVALGTDGWVRQKRSEWDDRAKRVRERMESGE
jgi:hypothetical protein